MDLGRLRARLASPLTEVESTECGIVDELSIEAGGRMVKMLCAPWKDPQDLLQFLEALDTDMIILNANLADGADSVSPVVMTKLCRSSTATCRPHLTPCKQLWSHLELQRTITGMRKCNCVTGYRVRARREKVEFKCKHWFWWPV